MISASGFVFFREFGFYSAIALAVTREDDLPSTSRRRCQLAVILLRAVIHVNDGRGDFARRGIEIECGTARLSYVALSPSIGCLGTGEFFVLGLHEFECDFARLRQPCAVGDDFGVESETLY